MKKKIVIASTLKPVDDVRVFWKFSQSMVKTNKYEVNIIGNRTKKEIDISKTHFHSHDLVRTNWLKRFLIRELILFKILVIKPSLLIITTHELINTALIAKLLIRCKVIYDVQENYSANLKYLNHPFKKLYALAVRLQENLSKIFVNQYWLAEKCYTDELQFISNHHIILENKAMYYDITEKNSNSIHMIFSGTISTYGGVENAIKIFVAIQKIRPETLLHIIGQVHDNHLCQQLIEYKKFLPNIKLSMSEKPVPYIEILEAISNANLGVIGYEENVVNRNKIPTKLYEYSRYRLPYIVGEGTLWSRKGQELGGAIPVIFDSIDAQKILHILSNPDGLFKNPYPASETWEHESIKLIDSLNKLI